MKKFIIGLSIAFAFTSVLAQEWIRVANNTENNYEIKRGTVEPGTTVSGTKIYAAIGRTTNETSKKITGAVWYVSVEHCRLQRGKFVVLGTSGDFQSDHDFVFGLGTIAATIAEVICTVATSDQPSNKPNKSPNV